MSKTFYINGDKLLDGEVNISGSKNCALCLIAGALLVDGQTKLINIPHIKDIEKFIDILRYLNVDVVFNNDELLIDTTNIQIKTLKIDEVSQFRASYYLIGALLNRFKKIEINKSGGCNFTPRPINYHIEMFKFFGVICKEYDTYYSFELTQNKESEFTLPYPSFGATINSLLFGVSLNREITIKNACEEVEIAHFIKFLRSMGADIISESNNLYINPSNLSATSFYNIPDRIEAGTFMLMGPIIMKKLKINNIIPEHNKSILDLFSFLDINYEMNSNSFTIWKQNINNSCIVETGFNETISSDLQPLLSVFCLHIPRISLIKEKVYLSRFTHIKPLQKMGGEIYESNHNILINGIMKLCGKEIVATDLRMAAAMVFAGLCAEGQTIIREGNYIDRGYEDILNKLKSLGADIYVKET